ncbi:MAG: hypothetical protein PHY31_04540 [Smithellaceae bacterium]|nr:hypothetical protein [Smithellaceae bacterium]
MKKIVALIIIIAMLGAQQLLASTESPGAIQGAFDSEDYNVYAVICDMGGVLISTTAAGRKVTPADLGAGASPQAREQALKEACADFNKKNAEGYLLDEALLKERGITAITEQRRQEVFSSFDLGWREFRRLYGNAFLIRVSRVGFNAEKTLAVVYRSEVADPEMGSGELLVLERSDRKSPWKVAAEIQLWIS